MYGACQLDLRTNLLYEHCSDCGGTCSLLFPPIIMHADAAPTAVPTSGFAAQTLGPSAAGFIIDPVAVPSTSFMPRIFHLVRELQPPELGCAVVHLSVAQSSCCRRRTVQMPVPQTDHQHAAHLCAADVFVMVQCVHAGWVMCPFSSSWLRCRL